MKRYKFITIDIEGDVSSRICRDNFTEDTLYRDPNTITWLCSFYNGKVHKAMGRNWQENGTKSSINAKIIRM